VGRGEGLGVSMASILGDTGETVERYQKKTDSYIGEIKPRREGKKADIYLETGFGRGWGGLFLEKGKPLQVRSGPVLKAGEGKRPRDRRSFWGGGETSRSEGKM